MHSKMDVPKKSKRLIVWNGGSIVLPFFDATEILGTKILCVYQLISSLVYRKNKFTVTNLSVLSGASSLFLATNIIWLA
jgi:hypothetical protein